MAVTNIDDDHDLTGITAFIPNNENDGSARDGRPISDGWVEVSYDPRELNGYQTELFREEALDVCGC